VVGSERNVVIDGKAVRGRKTRWGVISGKKKKGAVLLNRSGRYGAKRDRRDMNTNPLFLTLLFSYT
jgi:hypothetical protein